MTTRTATYEMGSNNYAFVDGQNVNLGLRDLAWAFDWRRFRNYLEDAHGVTRAYLFMGLLPENEPLYGRLQRNGFVLVFKRVTRTPWGETKANVDADLVLRAMTEFDQYDKGVIVTSDGDLHSLVEYLDLKRKLQAVLSPCIASCSLLLKECAGGRLVFLETLRAELERRPERRRRRAVARTEKATGTIRWHGLSLCPARR
jgi:hypothetical protein